MPDTQPDLIEQAFEAYKEDGVSEELLGLLAAHAIKPVYLHGFASTRYVVRLSKQGRKESRIEPYYSSGIPSESRVPWCLPDNRLRSISNAGSLVVESRTLNNIKTPSSLRVGATYALGFALEDLSVLRGK